MRGTVAEDASPSPARVPEGRTVRIEVESVVGQCPQLGEEDKPVLVTVSRLRLCSAERLHEGEKGRRDALRDVGDERRPEWLVPHEFPGTPHRERENEES